jgi:hypothetical protein
MTQQQRVTRKPTGKPGWPFVLIAGGEKCGKTWSAAEFTTSPLLGRTFWIEVGEDTADLYGALPGANYEIVEHDGTYRDILDALTWVTQQPRVNGKPNGIVFDSLSVLWELLGNEQQRVANDRAMEKARKYSRRMPTEEARVTTDLWNDATDRWYGIIKLLKGHDGPVVATARLEQVTAMGDDGQPTKEKWWKVAAQKRLRNDATATVEMREPQKAELSTPSPRVAGFRCPASRSTTSCSSSAWRTPARSAHRPMSHRTLRPSSVRGRSTPTSWRRRSRPRCATAPRTR